MAAARAADRAARAAAAAQYQEPDWVQAGIFCCRRVMNRSCLHGLMRQECDLVA